MTALRTAAQQALEALEFNQARWQGKDEAIEALRAALAAEPVRDLAPPERKPLTEEEIEKAYREIWRDLPSDFDHTSSGWIEQGIKYAERAHGIT